MKFLFSYFCGSFLPSWIRIWIRIPNMYPDPDPLSCLNPDPIRIRISRSANFTVFLSTISRTAKDIEMLIESLPSEESSTELQSEGLRYGTRTTYRIHRPRIQRHGPDSHPVFKTEILRKKTLNSANVPYMLMSN
jgi:hypothetical protein